jgi:hypothetical protein
MATDLRLRKRFASLVVFMAWPSFSLGHDLPGLDAERRAQAELFARGMASVPDIQSPRPNAATPKVAPAAPAAASPKTVGNGKLSAQQLNSLKKLTDRNNGAIVILNDKVPGFARGPISVAGVAGNSTIESVIVGARVWGPGTTIKVCFLEASAPEPRQAIARYAAEWTKYGNATFDFGTPPMLRTCAVRDGSDVRITFRTTGYAAYVGTDAKPYAASGMPTVFLKDFDVEDYNTPHFRGTVEHEFGHVLGFAHEHQTPIADCQAQLNLPAVKAAYSWDDEQMQVNILRIRVAQPFVGTGGFQTGQSVLGPVDFSKYDRMSVMHYSLPVELFKQPPGSCYLQAANNDLSDIDKVGMAHAYPRGVALSTFNAQHNARIDATLKSSLLSNVQREALKAFRR